MGHFGMTSMMMMMMIASVDVQAFVPGSVQLFGRSIDKKSTGLYAIGVLARKAKEMEVAKYLETAEEEDPAVMALYHQIVSSSETSSVSERKDSALRTALHKRRGTLAVVAEYRRSDKGGFVDEVYEANFLSKTYREFGASAVAVLADVRVGGCDYSDVVETTSEQGTALGDVPGPLPVICSDTVVHPVQVARAKQAGAAAVLVHSGIVGGTTDTLETLVRAAHALDMDVLVSVDGVDSARRALEAGARILVAPVCGTLEGSTPEEAMAYLEEACEGYDTDDNNNDQTVLKVANILARDDKGLQEVEDAWVCRDKGFHGVWASEFLYKSGNDAVEHPGAIIRSLKSKSSVKYASATARSGKGEGAKEYLGDILM